MPNAKTIFEVTNLGVVGQPAEIRIYDNIGIKTDESPGYFAAAFGAALSKVPKESKVRIRINSLGGSIPEAQTMCSLLKERAGKTECIIDGVCMSSATLIACSCDSTRMVRGGLFMIHNPQGEREGDAKVFRNAAKVLESYTALAVSIYAAKTGLSPETLSDMMDNVTYLDCDEALKLGFIDGIIEEQSTMFHASIFTPEIESIPEPFRRLFTDKETNMPNKNIEVPPPSGEPNVEPAPVNKAEPTQNQQQTPPPANINPGPEPTPAINASELAAMVARIKQFELRDATMFVETAIKDGKIENTRKDFWVGQIMSNPTMRDEIDKLPIKIVQNQPIEDHTNVVQVGTSIDDISNQFSMLDKAGNTNKKFALLFKHNAFLKKAFAENAITVDSTLKRTHIEADVVLTDFFAPLSGIFDGFTTTWDNIPRLGEDKIVVPRIVTPEDPVKNYNPEVGLETGNRESTGVVLTLNKHKTVGLSYNSLDSNKQPYQLLTDQYKVMLMQLKKVVVDDILSVITAENFPAVVNSDGVEAEDFDKSDVIKARKACINNKWPKEGRYLYLNPDYEEALLNDPTLTTWAGHAMEAISATTTGRLPKLSDFNFYSSDSIPDNGERLVGWCCLKNAVGVVGAPVKLDPALSRVAEYETITDPVTGLTIGRQTWADPVKRNVNVVYEILYGYGVLNSASLIRLISQS